MVLVRNKDSSVFLDFGQAFNLLDDFFVPEAYLFPRGRFGLRDYFALGLAPKIPGLYSEAALRFTEFPYQEPQFDAVFISHPHIDHYSRLEYLDPRIPVYTGSTSKAILYANQELNRARIFSTESQANEFRTGKKIRIGSIEITPIHVDHSVPGSYGFLVDCGDRRIAYTGDIRRHGQKPELTEDFIKAAQGFEPDMLIIEGTRVALEERRKNYTENQVEEESEKIISANKGITVTMRYQRDLDRFQSFYSIAKEQGKEFVISQKTASLLLYLKDDPIALPNPLADSTIRIFHRAKLRYEPWEERLEVYSVGTDYIRKNRDSIMLEMDAYYMTELIDIAPEKGELIYSMSEPFEEDPRSIRLDEVLRNWAQQFGLGYHQLHASGHASMAEIFEMVGEINPKKVVPIHCQHPELFKQCGRETVVARKGEVFE